MKIAIVSPKAVGGVATTVNQLNEALQHEGFKVSLIVLDGTSLLNIYLKSFKEMRLLQHQDFIIFAGSIPPPVSITIPPDRGKALFVHGFVTQEIINTIISTKVRFSIREKIGGLILLSRWKYATTVENFDFFICRSITSCEENKLMRKPYVILPQFILPSDITYAEKVLQKLTHVEKVKFKPIILTYASYANSPRLLTLNSLLKLAKSLNAMLKKQIKFIIVNPHIKHVVSINYGNIDIKMLPALPREDFLKMLASADLFIDICLDEELRLTSLEAGLLGTPIAKITLPKFIERQDYSHNEVILAHSIKDLSKNIAEFINNLEYYRDFYSKNYKRYVIERRSWHAVKSDFITKILQSKL